MSKMFDYIFSKTGNNFYLKIDFLRRGITLFQLGSKLWATPDFEW